MRWFGLDRSNGKDMRCAQDPPFWGYKFHMNDIAATIGLANLEHVCYVVRKTRAHAQKYNRYLQDCKNVKVIPFDRNRGRSGHWLYTVFVDNPSDFISYMRQNGVEASKVHDRNDTKTIFKESRLPLPGVDYFDAHHVCIPVGWWLLPEDTDKVIELCHNYQS
jgi:dTDP-4-amino-4,6-dideoxygalactose transaminase